MESLDLVIRNVTLYDGSGGAPVLRAAVGVKDGRIAMIGGDGGVGDGGGEGAPAPPSASREVDGRGMALMPGIIDVHTHYDAQITWDSGLTPSPAMGVTTALIGNCGFTIAPCTPGNRERTMANLTQVEGMSLDVLRAGINWEFRSFPEYLDFIERQGLVPNVAAFIGHSALRTHIMGEGATTRGATSAEIGMMAGTVREAMAAGAIGFATSTAPQHNGAGGVPMPSRLAEDQEFYALAQAMASDRRGVFMITKGKHTNVAWLENLARTISRPVSIAALLHNPTRPDGIDNELAEIEVAQGRGAELWGQVSCCPLTMDFSIASAYPLEDLAAWQPVMKAANLEAKKTVLADPNFRDAVRAELARPAEAVRLFNGEWDKLFLTTAADPAHAGFEHRPIAEVAAEVGGDPLDWMLDIALAEDLQSGFTAELLNTDEAAVARLLTHPCSLVALSDAGAHLTFFCDAGYGLHLLGHWSRERGVLPLEAATHALTARPAAIYRIPERGRIAPGYHADLLLFDPETVGRGPRYRVHDLPGNAPRLTTDAKGVHGVWVNGVGVSGNLAAPEPGAQPGKLLRDFNI